MLATYLVVSHLEVGLVSVLSSFVTQNTSPPEWYQWAAPWVSGGVTAVGVVVAVLNSDRLMAAERAKEQADLAAQRLAEISILNDCLEVIDNTDRDLAGPNPVDDPEIYLQLRNMLRVINHRLRRTDLPPKTVNALFAARYFMELLTDNIHTYESKNNGTVRTFLIRVRDNVTLQRDRLLA